MEKVDSLQEVERRAYQSTFEDGFYELLWGGLFLLFSLIPLVESIGISRFYCYPFILILAVIPWVGKRYITIPRYGAVEYGKKRKSRKRFTVLISIMAVIMMLPLVIMMITRGFPGGLTWRAVALIAAPVIAIGVYLMDYSRMYIYALFFFFSIVASEFLYNYIGMPYNNLITFGVPGTALIGYGFSLLIRFLKEYPKPATEDSDVCR